MFLEAFPQPQEHGGTTPLGRALQILRARLPWVDVSTIRRSDQLFNWNLAGMHGAGTVRVDRARSKVQTFLDSMGAAGHDSRFVSLFFIGSLDVSSPNARRLRAFGDPQ
jgi:hypothetical protein